jgi:FSR family fosmidomycin resistance protein-like MFS transporter
VAHRIHRRKCRLDQELLRTKGDHPDGEEARGSHRAGFNSYVAGALSFTHLLNDLIQSLLIASYPLLKQSFALSFAQVGLITLAYQLTASLLQPLMGLRADQRPIGYSLPIGMGFTLMGVLLLAGAPNFPSLILAASLIGTGSSIFHPTSSRITRIASSGRHGFGQSLFQVGGNVGAAIGPLLVAVLVIPYGRKSLAWFSVLALVAIVLLFKVSHWHRRSATPAHSTAAMSGRRISKGRMAGIFGILGVLVFSKYLYLASVTSFLIFYLMHKFGLSIESAQLRLFGFLAAVAVGSLVGGPLGDRIGRRPIIWLSIIGAAPFTLVLPAANLALTTALLVAIGLILASAFSAILVYAQDLVPHRVGTVAGLFFGFAFGMAGLSAAVLGYFADRVGIEALYRVCALMPLMGLVGLLLPEIPKGRQLIAN